MWRCIDIKVSYSKDTMGCSKVCDEHSILAAPDEVIYPLKAISQPQVENREFIYTCMRVMISIILIFMNGKIKKNGSSRVRTLSPENFLF